jgi:hypothetical protein
MNEREVRGKKGFEMQWGESADQTGRKGLPLRGTRRAVDFQRFQELHNFFYLRMGALETKIAVADARLSPSA